ncbi:hypothetical protein RUM43_009313 [Polyplax serrata]|uniref:Uncharacterized protein n=1 Tax=Polyplax serrata TaxID=468196 RepID=A0AAN8S134_POLSC
MEVGVEWKDTMLQMFQMHLPRRVETHISDCLVDGTSSGTLLTLPTIWTEGFVVVWIIRYPAQGKNENNMGGLVD